MSVHDKAVEAAFATPVGGNDVSGPDVAGDFLTREQLRLVLEAALPYLPQTVNNFAITNVSEARA